MVYHFREHYFYSIFFFNRLSLGFKGTLIEKVAYISLMILLATNSVFLFKIRKHFF